MPKIPETDDFVVDLRNRDKQEKFEKIPDAKYQIPATGMWRFIQYNNGFLIILVVCILAFGSLSFASEEVRDATIGGKQVLAEGVDNTLLLEQNFEKFNMDFKITGILEDEESYTVSYSYVDFDIKDGVWQFIEKQGARKISKPFRQDLGVYLAEQLRQEAQARLKELKKLQKDEREKGLTKVVQVTEYSGLIGKVLDLSAAVFPGYEPVKKVELPTPAADTILVSRTQTSGAADNLTNVYSNYVAEHPEQMAELNSNGGTGDEAASDAGTASSTVSSETQSIESDASSTANEVNQDMGTADVPAENVNGTSETQMPAAADSNEGAAEEAPQNPQ